MTAPTPNPDPTTAPAPAGATPPNTAPTDTTSTSSEPKAGEPPATPPSDDTPLGPAGLKALNDEREARKALAKELKTYEPLKKLLGALGSGEPAAGKSEAEQLSERFAALEQQVTSEQQARHRAEVAHAKGLTPEQAARLVGSTHEELEADADALLALFPAAAPGTPKPDPHQGARGGTGVDIDARIAEAQKAGDWRTVLNLQNQKLANQSK